MSISELQAHPESVQPARGQPAPLGALDLEQMVSSVHLAEAATRAATKEIHDTRQRLRRTEAALALVLGSLVELKTPEGDYALHRLGQELRRLAETPECAAKVVGCEPSDIDPALLQLIGSHLYGAASGSAWLAPSSPVTAH